MALKRIKNLDVWSDLFPYGDKIDNTNQTFLWCNSVYKVKFPQHSKKTASRLIMHDFQFCFLLCILQSPFAITFPGHAHDCSLPVFCCFLVSFHLLRTDPSSSHPAPGNQSPGNSGPKTHGWLTAIYTHAKNPCCRISYLPHATEAVAIHYLS